MFRLIPREIKFFEMFAEMTSNLTEAAHLLRRMLLHHEEIPQAVRQFKEIEHRGDEMTHGILTKLNQTFMLLITLHQIYLLMLH